MGKFWIENEIIDNGLLGKIEGSSLKILLAITRHYNKYGTCYPSIRRLSKLTNLHHSTVSEHLRKLQLLGLLEQLVIKERCKLRYSFTKTDRKNFIDNQKLLGKPDSKEVFKEVFKEEKNIKKYRGRELMEKARKEGLKK